MIKVAIVEDDEECVDLLKSYIERYCKENGVDVQVVCYSDGIDIVSEYSSDYDIILLDIVMKHMKGMQTAQYIRNSDTKVIIIFITGCAQYAIDGYSVDALSYLLKPVNYVTFACQFERCVEKVEHDRTDYVTFSTEKGIDRIDTAKIVYVESRGHQMIIHTAGDCYYVYETMKKIESLLPKDRFTRCNNCYLVNLAYVEGVHGDYCLIGGDELKISRPKRKVFVDELTAYCALK